MNKDICVYLTDTIKDFLFSELDPFFLDANDLGFLRDVPIPIRQEDLMSFTNQGLSTTKIADNMALVIGADSNFKYADYYLRYIKKLFNEKIISVFTSKAEKLINDGEYRTALCYLRAALQVDPSGTQSMYCYANGCRIWYQSLEGEDEEQLIRLLKSEANQYFSQLTNIYPEFAPAWYYLGYAYLNSGSYTKADLAFKHYLDNSEGMPKEDIKEIKDRIEELKDPVIIEDGKNLLIAGKYEESLKVLEPYVDSKYDNWWPLHYYLAVAYEQLGYTDEAFEGYKRVLSLNPSNYDAAIALSELYDANGESEKAKKYADKAAIILENSNDND